MSRGFPAVVKPTCADRLHFEDDGTAYVFASVVCRCRLSPTFFDPDIQVRERWNAKDTGKRGAWFCTRHHPRKQRAEVAVNGVEAELRDLGWKRGAKLRQFESEALIAFDAAPDARSIAELLEAWAKHPPRALDLALEHLTRYRRMLAQEAKLQESLAKGRAFLANVTAEVAKEADEARKKAKAVARKLGTEAPKKPKNEPRTLARGPKKPKG